MRNVLLTFSLLLFAGMSFGQIKIVTNGDVAVGHSSPLGDLHIQDSGNVANVMVERIDQNNFVNLSSGSTGNTFYYAAAKRFAVNPAATITTTSPDAPNALFFYGPNWSTAANAGNMGVGTDSPTEKVDVSGSVKAAGYITASDMRLKKIEKNSIDYGLKEIMNINPVKFTYNGKGGTPEGSSHIGVIAQELQEIAPDLVQEFSHVTYEYDDQGDQKYVGEETFLEIRDSEIKYLLINAVKEQQELIEAQNERIAEMEAMIINLANGTTTQAVEVKDSRLGQNAPNPFNQSTVISYTVPTKSTTAVLQIFDLNGQMLKAVNVANGNGQLTINAGELAAGTYSYNLVVDGVVVDTKKMVLTK